MIFVHNPGRGSRLGNMLMLLAVSAILLFTLAWQLLFGAPGCPLCLLQRAALVLAGVGLLLNVRLGPSPMHYAMVLAGALGGLAAAGRQILQQVVPGAVVSSDTLLGLRWPTWSALACLGLLLFALVMLIIDRKWGDNALRRPVGLPGAIVMAVLLVSVLAGALGAALNCGNVECEAPRPVIYLQQGS